MENTTISGYVLKYKLGEGGMAEVWYAENSLQMPAAIKVLQKRFCSDPELVSRFENEAKLMVQLNHPNIRKMLDFSAVDARPCMVMEYLHGKDLSQRLKAGERFSNDQLIKWWNDLVDALQYTHQKNIIHRDIKPSNLFLTDDGQIKMLDFGIAKIKDNITLTQTGSRMGTLMYMSPEQVYDMKTLSYKTDVYSLAVSFYHLVTGAAPYDNQLSDFEVQENIVRKNLNTAVLPQPWRSLLPDYLSKNPEERKELRKLDKVESERLATSAGGYAATPAVGSAPDALLQPRRKNGRNIFFSLLVIAGLVYMALNKDTIKQFLKTDGSGDRNKKTVVQPRPQPPIQDTEAQIPAVVLPDTLPAPSEQDIESVTITIDVKEKELNVKNLLTDYYTNRSNCGNLYRYFRDTVKQYYTKSNVTLDEVMKECQRYHDKWKFTEADFDESSFSFTHQENGNLLVDFSMLYKIKQNENDEWSNYNVDVSAIVDENMKITRIVERRIEKL
ncbi:MAG: serine/threonine protein kinase [Sphingobacteriales bacterium]|nr:serine/threonine protein kinase [Sphingobacteriales bacterium]